MGQRLLEVSIDLLVSILQGLADGPPRSFQIESDPIPADAKILSVYYSPYRTNTVEIVLQSKEWTDEPPRTKINPVVKTVYAPSNVVYASVDMG